MGWTACGQWDLASARTRIAESLAIWRELDDPGRIVNVLDSLGIILFFQGEADAARALFDEELARATELGDKTHVAWSLFHLGGVAGYQDQFAAACALYEQCLVIWRELNVQGELAFTLFDLGSAMREQGEYRAAHAILAESLAIARKWGSNPYITLALADLGMVAGELGDWEQAAAHLTEGLRVSCEGEAGDQLLIARCLTGLGRVALARARPARAARLLGTAAARRAACSFSAWPCERRECARYVSAARGQLDEAEFAAAWSEGEAMPLDQAIALALQEVTGG
jgi:tetratricopeptide (TPR) repeat protein